MEEIYDAAAVERAAQEYWDRRRTFEVLEEVKAPFEPSILVLVRESVTKVDPGDYGFMVANAATAQAL